MFSHLLIPFINGPTRVTTNSATIIDDIHLNEIRNDQLSGISYTYISDNFPRVIIDRSCTTYALPQYFVKRHCIWDNILKFENTLKEIDFSPILNSNDPQNAFTKFQDIFSHAHDKCFSLKWIKMNYRNKNRWLIHGLKNSNRQQISSMLNQWNLPLSTILTNIKNTNECWIVYWRKVNKIVIILNFATNVLKKCWTLIEQMVDKKCRAQCSQFIVDGRITSDNGGVQ